MWTESTRLEKSTWPAALSKLRLTLRSLESCSLWLSETSWVRPDLPALKTLINTYSCLTWAVTVPVRLHACRHAVTRLASAPSCVDRRRRAFRRSERLETTQWASSTKHSHWLFSKYVFWEGESIEAAVRWRWSLLTLSSDDWLSLIRVIARALSPSLSVTHETPKEEQLFQAQWEVCEKCQRWDGGGR